MRDAPAPAPEPPERVDRARLHLDAEDVRGRLHQDVDLGAFARRLRAFVRQGGSSKTRKLVSRIGIQDRVVSCVLRENLPA